MTAQVLSFFRRTDAQRDWSAHDLAEFYRVEAALIQAGLHVDSARGLTDEGEPWFVFCRTEDDEVIIHFARIAGRYVISAPSYCGTASGYDFRALVRSMIERNPVLRLNPNDNRLFVHPASLLIVLVASALLQASKAAAATAAEHGPHTPTEDAKSGDTVKNITSEPVHEAIMLAAVAAAIATPVLVDDINAVLPADVHAGHVASVSDQLSLPSIEAKLMDQWHQPVQADGRADIFASLTLAHHVTETSAATPLMGPTPTSDVSLVNSTDLHSQGFSPTNESLMSATPIATVPIETASGSPATPSELPLSAFFNISQADKELLQALGVTNASAPAPNSPDTVSQLSHDGAHFGVGNVQAEPASAPPSTSMEAAPAPTASHAPVPELAMVMASVMQFQAVEVQPVVLITDHAAIFYDAHAVTTDLQDVRSVTYDFQDGFSISLVGLPSELAHAHIHM